MNRNDTKKLDYLMTGIFKVIKTIKERKLLNEPE